MVKTVDGKEVCGYELDQWKAALKVDAAYASSLIKMKKLEEKSAELLKQVVQLKIQVGAYKEAHKLLSDKVDKLFKDLIELDKKYQDERVKFRLGSPVAWGVAAVAVSVLGGMLLNDVLD